MWGERRYKIKGRNEGMKGDERKERKIRRRVNRGINEENNKEKE